MTRDGGEARQGLVGATEILLWLAMPIIGVLGYFWVMVQGFSTVGCEGICRDELIYVTLAAIPWALGSAIAIAIAAAIVLRILRRRTVWAPVVGVGLLVGSLAVSGILLGIGFAPMHERNDGIARGELPAVPPPPDPAGMWGNAGEGKPFLNVADDGSFEGSDGCNGFAGVWSQDAEGVIVFTDVVADTKPCDGVDTWLAQGRQAFVLNDYLYIQDAAGSTIGGLAPAE